MPYCPNCGDEVAEAHFYCGQCGESLSDKSDDERNVPLRSATGSGFLSGKSIEYANTAFKEGIDEEDPGYANLKQDVGAAMVDFGIVGAIDDLNLLKIILTQHDQINSETEEKLLILGFFRIPKLYDQIIGTEFEDEVADKVTELLESAKDAIDE